MKKSYVWIIVIAVGLILCANGCSTYNSLVTESEGVESAWAKVETQYQRRFDLIPNLVETVKGYAKHEKDTYLEVTEARSGSLKAYDQATSQLDQAYQQAKGLEGADMSSEESFQKYTNAQADLNKAFNIYVNAVKEAYPDLKANEQFRDLQVQLEGTENRIATERTYYTDVVKEYNIKVRRFPAKIWAGIFGFGPKPQYKADTEAQSAPKVTF